MNIPKAIEEWETKSNFKRACKIFLIKKRPVPQQKQLRCNFGKAWHLDKSQTVMKHTKAMIIAHFPKHKDLLHLGKSV